MSILPWHKHVGLLSVLGRREREGAFPRGPQKKSAWNTHTEGTVPGTASQLQLPALLTSCTLRGAELEAKKNHTEKAVIQTVVICHCPNTTSYIPGSTFISFGGGELSYTVQVIHYIYSLLLHHSIQGVFVFSFLLSSPYRFTALCQLPLIIATVAFDFCLIT